MFPHRFLILDTAGILLIFLFDGLFICFCWCDSHWARTNVQEDLSVNPVASAQDLELSLRPGGGLTTWIDLACGKETL